MSVVRYVCSLVFVLLLVIGGCGDDDDEHSMLAARGEPCTRDEGCAAGTCDIQRAATVGTCQGTGPAETDGDAPVQRCESADDCAGGKRCSSQGYCYAIGSASGIVLDGGE